MDNETQLWRDTLRQMPLPEPRERFADYALSWASRGGAPQVQATKPSGFTRVMTRWETWMGMAIGAAAAAGVAGVLMRAPAGSVAPSSPGITLALNEVRSIDVLVDSERALRGATIRVALSDGLSLEGFEGEHEIRWN